MAKDPIVIVGAGEFARIAFEYFTHDSDCEVVAFAVEREFLTEPEVCGLPVVPFEALVDEFDPLRVRLHVAVTYTQLNRVRKRLYLAAKAMGFGFVNYVSSNAFVWRNVEIGENVFIFENNVVQPFTKIGNNVVLWSGNHIGHRTVIRDHTYVSSHVVISGYCDIGECCFVGVNATFADSVTLGPDSFVAMSAGVTKSLAGGLVYKGMPAQGSRSAFEYLGVKEE